jgi:hypothetical protein
MAHQVQDGVNGRLSHMIAGREVDVEGQGGNDTHHPRGFGAPPGGDGIADSSVDMHNPLQGDDLEARSAEAEKAGTDNGTEEEGRGSNGCIAVDAPEVEMADRSPDRASASSPPGLSADLVKKGLLAVLRKLSEGDSPPTMFEVVKAIGTKYHERIIGRQRAAADAMLTEPTCGPQIAEVKDVEVADEMHQQAVLTPAAEELKNKCRAPAFARKVDIELLTGLLCSLAEFALPGFEEALVELSTSVSSAVKLKMAPIKQAGRCGVKVDEYREEMGEENWPHSQYLTDVLRASLIVDTAEDMVKVWESLNRSSVFKVVRLKNKIGKGKGPFNMHVNLTYSDSLHENPILCEIQIYPRDVYDLQKCQHMMYEIRRAPGVEHLMYSE